MIPTFQIAQLGFGGNDFPYETDPHWGNVFLLLDMETGTDGSTTFIDRSSSGRTVTANGNAQVDTGLSKFGSRSAIFDGTGDYLSAADSPNIDIGTGDFTVELYANMTGQSDHQALFAFDGIGSGLYIYRIGAVDPINNGKLALSDSVTSRAIGNASMSVGSWVHIAWVRESGVHSLFIEGIKQTATWSSGGSPSGAYDPTEIRIGMHPLDIQPLLGSVDEVRGTLVARYSSNFTVRTSAFPQG